MAFTTFTGEVNNISQLSDTPTLTEGLSPDELKARFDLGNVRIKDYINNTLLPQLENASAAASLGAVSVSGFEQFSTVQTALALIISHILNLEDEIGGSASIGDGSVTTVKLADSAVTEDKIGAGAVSKEKIANNAVSTLLTANVGMTWAGSGPYTQTVTVSGVRASDTPIIDMVMTGTFSTDKERLAEFSKIYRAVTADGSITFYADERPTKAFSVRMLCVRK
ncbi:MAG: hypothetical protein IKR93_05245 [Firmicutes bacterium]|nr:hypothetical protein [Bacillota bacterium]